ncbi:TRAP transporter substrate-binding protein DctP [Mesobacillus maritimus]|uniref:TRAP transporter substrate-binding protein DctP n=1 Tax=Mesobacillus maritimus TaxID=1643336 RepID=UPI00203F971A|nr:TRAP transporter substrate-binding protein DctP [Mesobacillus maritimus]MCM3670747.1 TRAP transporter substrate-binding protein DctP [Mesobacillus maritimus]
MKKSKSFLSIGLVALLIFGVLAACSSKGSSGSGDSSGDAGGKPITLKLSHQWPQATADEGDFRSRLAVKFAEEVEKRTDGQVKIQQYPANSLVKAAEQYESMLKGASDMSVYPLDYAGGKVPEFGITLMPALVKNHDQAIAWETSEIGKKVEEIAEENGLKILVWVWNAGAIGTKGDPITAPEDVKEGAQMRAAGKMVEEMLAKAGAGITSMPSSEIYSGFQTNLLDAAVTSNSSFAAYKLYEQVDSFTTSLENTFWFMFEPLVISTSTWEKLTPEQQQIFEEVATELQPWAYEASIEDDENVAKIFKENDVNVVDMSDEDYQKWVELSEPIWEKFAAEVEGGQELIDLAKEVNQME